MKIFYILVLFIFLYYISYRPNYIIEPLQFGNNIMEKSYLKHNVLHNKTDKELTKCDSMKHCKILNYTTQLNHPNSNHISDNNHIPSYYYGYYYINIYN